MVEDGAGAAAIGRLVDGERPLLRAWVCFSLLPLLILPVVVVLWVQVDEWVKIVP